MRGGGRPKAPARWQSSCVDAATPMGSSCPLAPRLAPSDQAASGGGHLASVGITKAERGMEAEASMVPGRAPWSLCAIGR